MSYELPSLPDDERRLLSCVFIDGAESFSKAINAGVGMQTFTDRRNGLVFDAMAGIVASGGAIDPQSVASLMQARQTLDAAGGWPHFIDLTRAEASTANLWTFIQRLRNVELTRGVMSEAMRLLDECSALRDEEPTTVIDPSLGRMMALAARSGSAQEPEWDGVIRSADEQLQRIIAQGSVPDEKAICWPWRQLDHQFAPQARRQLNIIAARPSIGKSSLARPVALHAARMGRKVYYATLETDAEQVPLLMAASLSGLGLRQARYAHASEQEKLRSALKSLHGLGITITRRDRTISRICGRARSLHARGGLDLIVIDHGLILDDVAGAKPSDMVAAIGRVTKALKVLAMDLDCTVDLLWQLNRASVKEMNREPGLSDLQGAGSLEQDADKVIFIHRPTQDPRNGADQSGEKSPDEVPRYFQNLIQAKGRDDGTGMVSFEFMRRTATFKPIEA